MRHPLLLLGGAGAPVLLAPANGFPPATYVPAVAPLFARFQILSLPPRAMWPGVEPPPAAPGSWTSLALDLLAGLAQHRLPPLVAIGHSFGAVACVLAAARQPERFRGLVLLDPTIVTPDIMALIAAHRARGEAFFSPLAESARKRRASFDSAEQAFATWRKKPLFADWSDDAVRRYTRAMLRPRAGGGFELAWSPAWEAHYYESFHTGTWDALAALPPSIPLAIVGGETSDTLLPGAAALLRERLPLATHFTMPGYGHLFPLAAPAETSALLDRATASYSPPS
jgi:pimeloyl-ACP methyl ester carboxylesterase